jgi:hypothetical protein
MPARTRLRRDGPRAQSAAGAKKKDRAIAQFAASNELFDPVQDHGAARVNDASVVVGEERPAGEAQAEYELAERVG